MVRATDRARETASPHSPDLSPSLHPPGKLPHVDLGRIRADE
jgi:hypothetical protein